MRTGLPVSRNTVSAVIIGFFGSLRTGRPGRPGFFDFFNLYFFSCPRSLFRCILQQGEQIEQMRTLSEHLHVCPAISIFPVITGFLGACEQIEQIEHLFAHIPLFFTPDLPDIFNHGDHGDHGEKRKTKNIFQPQMNADSRR